jgi:putative protease
MAQEKPIGKITHFFSNIGVAIIELEDSLKVGDRIKIVSGDSRFEQEVDSMEVDRQKIQEAKKGDTIGLKVLEKSKEGAMVYKI